MPGERGRSGESTYGESSAGISTAVREWALDAGTNPAMWIALCGYAGEGHEALEAHGWDVVEWKNGGGYNNLGDGENRYRERIWFSPACVGLRQEVLPLFR